MLALMPVQGIMGEITDVGGEEDPNVEVVAVQGDKEVVPRLQTICKICKRQDDVVAWHLLELDIYSPQVDSMNKQPSHLTPHILTL
jgi:hypothetical protein